ncbi:MAG: response regulator [Chitinophagaceae bacterium]
MHTPVEKTSVVIIDDHKLIAEAWKSMLELQDRYQVVGVYHHPEEGAEAVKQKRPQVLLVDINMQPLSGIEVTKLVRKFSPGTKVIAVSLLTQPAIVKKIIKAGATGYLTKSSDKKELYEAIDQVLAGQLYICGEVKNIMAQINLATETDESKPDLNKLSDRELDIVRLLKKGQSSKEIATELSLSVRTVDAHRYNILKKLNLKNATALVNLVNEEGIMY